jgi:hypothetical protein
MTSEYIASKLSLLPQFEVETIDHDLEKQGKGMTLIGTFSEPVGYEDQTVNFFLPDMRYIHGLLLAAPEGQEIRYFKHDANWPTDIAETELLSKSLPYVGSYDARHIELAFNPDFKWEEIRFSEQKSIQCKVIGTDGLAYRKWIKYEEGAEIPEGSTIVENGWNHEHCAFCWRHIDPGDIGYASRHEYWKHEWACLWCYTHIVTPHDLRPIFTPFESRVMP